MKRKTAEYGSYTAQEASSTSVLDTAKAPNGTTYRLVFRSTGYRPAGSAAVWTEAHWAVNYEFAGATHGRAFNSETEARDYFARRIAAGSEAA